MSEQKPYVVVKAFDIQSEFFSYDRRFFETSRSLATAVGSYSNDAYYCLEMRAIEATLEQYSEEWSGYEVDVDRVKLLNDKLLSLGAIPGENILIYLGGN